MTDSPAKPIKAAKSVPSVSGPPVSVPPASVPPASVPIPAATIMLLRDGAQGLEVFMVVRHHQIDFASGALVFPGGKLDPQDEDERVLSRLAAFAPSTPVQARLRAAAIREVFEESGILLARDKHGAALTPNTQSDAWRKNLNAHTLTMPEILVEGDLTLACDDLVHYSHWITPPMMPKRFDTHFYLARVPVGQIADHDGHENVDSVWIRPKQAIEDAQNKVTRSFSRRFLMWCAWRSTTVWKRHLRVLDEHLSRPSRPGLRSVPMVAMSVVLRMLAILFLNKSCLSAQAKRRDERRSIRLH